MLGSPITAQRGPRATWGPEGLSVHLLLLHRLVPGIMLCPTKQGKFQLGLAGLPNPLDALSIRDTLLLESDVQSAFFLRAQARQLGKAVWRGFWCRMTAVDLSRALKYQPGACRMHKGLV